MMESDLHSSHILRVRGGRGRVRRSRKKSFQVVSALDSWKVGGDDKRFISNMDEVPESFVILTLRILYKPQVFVRKTGSVIRAL